MAKDFETIIDKITENLTDGLSNDVIKSELKTIFDEKVNKKVEEISKQVIDKFVKKHEFHLVDMKANSKMEAEVEYERIYDKKINRLKQNFSYKEDKYLQEIRDSKKQLEKEKRINDEKINEIKDNLTKYLVKDKIKKFSYEKKLSNLVDENDKLKRNLIMDKRHNMYNNTINKRDIEMKKTIQDLLKYNNELRIALTNSNLERIKDNIFFEESQDLSMNEKIKLKKLLQSKKYNTMNEFQYKKEIEKLKDEYIYKNVSVNNDQQQLEKNVTIDNNKLLDLNKKDINNKDVLYKNNPLLNPDTYKNLLKE